MTHLLLLLAVGGDEAVEEEDVGAGGDPRHLRAPSHPVAGLGEVLLVRHLLHGGGARAHARHPAGPHIPHSLPWVAPSQGHKPVSVCLFGLDS